MAGPRGSGLGLAQMLPSRRRRPGRRLSLAALAFVVAPWPGGAAEPGPPHRVVLVSFDGAGGEEWERQKGSGTFGPDGFLRAEREGFSARRLQVVSPSLTAPSHASMVTGASPGRTGIVSNTFHPAGESLAARARGFDVAPAVETLWEAAARQGHRVLSLAWPGITGSSPRLTVPVSIRWAEPRSRSLLWVGPAADHPFRDATFALPLDVRSYSPPKEVDVELPEGGTLRAAAVDGSDDGRRSYDELIVVSARGDVVARARPDEWFSVAERRAEDDGDRDVLVGRWLKLLELAPDLSRVAVYVGREARTHASPDDFRRTLDERAGFWPGPPDPLFLSGPRPDTRSFVEQAARLAAFFTSAYEVADRRGDWDLLLAYVPVIDEAAHVLTLTDPRQPGWSAERAEAFSGALREVWRIADRVAAHVLRFEGRGDVLLVSDRGTRAVRRELQPLELLRRHGMVRTETRHGRLVVAPDSPLDVVASGGTAFVIVNRAGVLPGGTVAPGEADRLVGQVATLFRTLVDEDGKPVFETVARPSDGTPPGLDGPNAGDLVLIAADGTVLKAGLAADGDAAPLFSPSKVLGQHGYGPDPALDGILLHVGDGIVPERVPVLPELAVASRVARRLGITLPEP